MLPEPRIVATTPTGQLTVVERESVELHGYQDAVSVRDTARIEVPGGQVHLDIYPAAAAGGGAAAHGTVVFVGGLSAHALLYAGFQAELARRNWNVVALDLRGHGRSSGGRGDFTTQTILDDLRGAIGYAQHRFGEAVGLLGSSLGGYYSLLGANAIDEVRCAISHWIFLPDQPLTRKDARMAPVAKLLDRLTPGLRISTRTLAEWDHVCEAQELRDKTFADPLMCWKYTVRALASGLRYRPQRPLTQLRCPHLVMIGECDRMTPMAYTRGIYEQLEGEKEWAVVPQAGHMGGLVEHREAALAVVEDFLARRLASRPEGDAELGAAAAPPAVGG